MKAGADSIRNATSGCRCEIRWLVMGRQDNEVTELQLLFYNGDIVDEIQVITRRTYPGSIRAHRPDSSATTVAGIRHPQADVIQTDCV
jgi:hypothetical protein